MLVLQTHYRSPVRVGTDNLEAAVKALAGLDAFAARVAPACAPADADGPTLAALPRGHGRRPRHARRRRRVLFDTVRRANTALDAGDPAKAASLAAAVLQMCAALGLVLDAGGDVPAEAQATAAALDAARAAKDFATADAMRAELQADGYLVETTKDGTRLFRRSA